MLTDLLWSMFEKSGDVKYYIMYKETLDNQNNVSSINLSKEEDLVSL